jgi:biopolymer transport protein TolR
MGMSAGGSKGGPKNDINVTPLVDVVLVLLIIFMVVTPMLQRGKDVKLPKAKNTSEENGQAGTKADPLILSVTPDKQLYIEADHYTDDEGFRARLEKELTENPYKRLLLKGDNSLTYGDVRKVLKLARDANAKGVALGVEELK